MAAVLGVSPYTSPFALWHAKNGKWIDDEMTENQEWGHILETPIAEVIAERYGLDLEMGEALYAHDDYPWATCSPDRLVVLHMETVLGRTQHVEPVEIKTDEGGAWGTPDTDQVPYHYKLQVRWQCWVLGARRGFLFRYAHKRLTRYVIFHDNDTDWQNIVTQCRAFLDTIENDIEPNIDDHVATSRALKKLYPTVDPSLPPVQIDDALYHEWTVLHTEVTMKHRRIQEIKNMIREHLGYAVHGVDSNGNIVVTRQTYLRRGYEVQPAFIDKVVRSLSDAAEPSGEGSGNT